MSALIMFDAQYGDTATDAWKKNKFDAWEWQVSNQTVAILQPVLNFTVAMQAKNYPTANHFLAGVDYLIASSAAKVPVQYPDDPRLIPATELHPTTRAARQAMHEDFVERFVTKLSDSDLRFYCIAALLDPSMKQWHWPGCQRDLSFAQLAFNEEYDKNWAPPIAETVAEPMVAPPHRATAPRWQGSMDFAFESVGAAATPPWSSGADTYSCSGTSTIGGTKVLGKNFQCRLSKRSCPAGLLAHAREEFPKPSQDGQAVPWLPSIISICGTYF